MAMPSASSSIHPTIHPVLFYILAGPYILLMAYPRPSSKKRNQVHRLQDDIEKCHVLIEDNAAKLKDNEQNRVELQEQIDRCQSSVRFWKYLFWLILLGLVASNYIAPKMI
uniref:Uncharacterized protein n=1 Tax=Oryza glumipatula TaxID=40148 RepID=A0A0D9Y681_9ORYZ